MNTLTGWGVITCAGAAVAIAGFAGVASVQHADGAGSEMQTGVTVTPTAAVDAPATMRAVPSITGPAPLPPEEQGLPG
jgi:hypothetical protein